MQYFREKIYQPHQSIKSKINYLNRYIQQQKHFMKYNL